MTSVDPQILLGLSEVNAHLVDLNYDKSIQPSIAKKSAQLKFINWNTKSTQYYESEGQSRIQKPICE